MMKQITVNCPKCNREGLINIPVDSVGKLPPVRCPNCGESFQHVIEQRLYHRKTPLPWLLYSPTEFDLEERSNFGDQASRIYRRIYMGELVDLSMTGCKGRTSEYPPKQWESIWLLFRLPDEELEMPGEKQITDEQTKAEALYPMPPTLLIHVGGEVVWSRKVSHGSFEFGVRFTAFKDDAQSIIETYLFSFDILDED